jgi:hypothetical protein
MRTLAAIRREAKARFGVNSLLGTNPKVEKSAKNSEMLTAILHLTPATSVFEVAGREVKRNVCAYAGNCLRPCLHGSGNPMYHVGKFRARRNRTAMFHFGRALFLELLEAEIAAHARKAERLGMGCAVRLNGTSDIKWETYGIMDKFPAVVFYDYTKHPHKGRRNLPTNYSLTFSYDDAAKLPEYLELLRAGENLAVAFTGKTLPTTAWGYKVVDGDITDFRPDDGRGVVVGLRAKRVTTGAADANVNNGFFVDPATV